MKEFMPNKNQNKKLTENVLAIAAKVREAKKHNPQTINATVGSYYDEDGNIKVFKAVKEVFENPNYNNILSYSSVKGSSDFSEAIKKWILGDDYQIKYDGYYKNLIATPGGTGALALAMGTYLDKKEGILLPNIMWPSYMQIATNLDIDVCLYELFDDNNHFNLASIDISCRLMQEKYGKVALIINDPCHNPTGYVMSEEDYKGLINLLNNHATKSKVILILDIAYLDYASEAGKNTRSYFELLKNLSANVMVLFTFSASKTFGIYGLRLGGLLQLTTSALDAKQFDMATAYFARSTWSNTTHLGMEIVEKALNDNTKKQAFIEEVKKAALNLEKRAKIFLAKLDEYEVPYAPYENGFFVLIMVDSPSFEKEIESHEAYGCHFGNGYRIALSSLNMEEASRMGTIIGKAYQKTKK